MKGGGRIQKTDAKEENEARAKIVRQIKPKRSFDYSHITTAKRGLSPIRRELLRE